VTVVVVCSVTWVVTQAVAVGVGPVNTVVVLVEVMVFPPTVVVLSSVIVETLVGRFVVAVG
jgi:hypothetical protein